jgi:hypothetical protein
MLSLHSKFEVSMKKLGLIQKLWLKYTNKQAYKTYKMEYDIFKHDVAYLQRTDIFMHLVQNMKPQNTAPPYTFKHSGNAGDIIYALPTVRALGQESKSKLCLHLNQTGIYYSDHPLGNVMLNQKMLDMLAPLLEAQSYVGSVEPYLSQAIDYNLDIVRDAPLMLNRGDISRWYMQVFNVFPNLSDAWLNVTPDTTYQSHIVLARSQRYNNPALDYSFLAKYKDILFLGVEKEYQLMKKAIPHLAYQPVKDFLELAQIIAGGKLFIGNQSFPYAIAEALKVKRILEVYHYCPNVVVHGADGHDVYFQPHFETLVQKLYV